MAEMEDSEAPNVEELLSLLLIQSVRNYDVLIHLLRHFDKEIAMKLLETHENMDLWGPLPFRVEE